ncbi:hypothetical protein RI129_002102 [Pyrocoelia pectoralis]|uniref:Uncharacterized protein n=1 Tax=Pyrocoelia pectoralis TaxID=417401 RepID=A0AAN7ZHN7_9COLE
MKFITISLTFLVLSTRLIHASTRLTETLDHDVRSKIPDEFIRSWEDLMVPNNKYCAQESEFDEKHIPNIFEKMDMSKKKLPCFAKCQYQRLEFMNSENKFDIQKMAQKISGLTEDIAAHCTHKFSEEEDLCNKVLSIIKCNVNLIAKKDM